MELVTATENVPLVQCLWLGASVALILVSLRYSALIHASMMSNVFG